MGRNILVVEDDRNICDLIHMYLVKEGFDVRIAGDGGKAIEEFQKQVPDLILLDVMLPKKNGFDVCRALRENGHRAILVDLFLGLEEVPADLAGVDAVVFGHSHKYVQEEKDGVLWLNPGSCGPRRFHQEITMMTAEAEDGKIRVEKVIIPHGTA